MLTELVVLQMRLKHFDIVSKTGRAAIDLAFSPKKQFFLGILRASHRASDANFERYFSRVAIAVMSADVATAVRARILASIHYWKITLSKLPGVPERVFAVHRLSTFI